MRFVAFLSFLLVCAIAGLFSCTKIEYTSLGVDLVPEVNNVTTFDTTLDVITENFLQSDDTMKLYYTDQLVAGQIKNDPQFGNTNAAVYFEVKPSSFSAAATAVNFRDSSLNATGVGYDSTVLSIKFDGGYGDTSQNIRFEVYALTDTIARLQDTIYPLVFQTKFQVPPGAQPLATKSVSLHSLAYDSVLVSRSSTLSYKKTKELRIRLPNDDFWKSLLSDTIALGDDVSYRKKFMGFAIKAIPNSSVGSLAYFSIYDTATKLQFYYRRRNAGAIDTTNTNFVFNPNNSGYANNVVWDKGAAAELGQNLNRVSPYAFVKANPGPQVRIRIPGLENISNRIIHRAELKTYVVPGNAAIDSILTPPPVLYLERYDSISFNNYLPIPFDLNPSELYGSCFPTTNGINYGYFGGYPRNEILNGINSRFYAFNISRYVQQIVTNKLRNLPLRLTANMNAQYGSSCSAGQPFRATTNIVSYGRAKLGGGGLTGSMAPYKMRLRIVYSKI